MNRVPTSLLTLSFVLALGAQGAIADEPAQATKLQDKIIGTWKLISAKYGGEDVKFTEGSTTLKHVTPAHFTWLTYEQDGKMVRCAGGGYTLKGEEYVETPEYGMSQDFETIKGKAQTFKCSIEGNKWHHDGKLSNGLTIEEVWERVERK
jgi:hypothetical protein